MLAYGVPPYLLYALSMRHPDGIVHKNLVPMNHVVVLSMFN